MGNPTRPLAAQQRAIIGTATLTGLGHRVEVIAKSTDPQTGAPFYVVRAGPNERWFGVWPDDLTDIVCCQPAGA